MSKLEAQAKPILTPMIHGKQSELSRPEQLVLARWATKSAVIYDTHMKVNEYFFTEADCQNFYIYGAQPFIDSAIYLARHDEVPSEQIKITETRQTGTPQSPYTNSDLFYLEAYSATFAIKHLALQIFVLRRHKELRKSGPISVGVPDLWRERTLCIWPNSDSVMWPPPVGLDNLTFGHFANRWRSPNIYSG
jgi:hypothetical protein